MRLPFWWILGLIGCLPVAGTLPLLADLWLLSVATLLPARKRSAATAKTSLRRLAVVIPAHNEELLIGRTVESLHRQHLAAGSILLVVAHNCTDRTAAHAREAGATVLEWNTPESGKAHALRHGFAHAFAAGAEAVIVVDADSVVSDNFLHTLGSRLSTDAEAVQCLYRVLPVAGAKSVAPSSIAFQGFNIVRPRGRERLGLSAGIFGNGFGLRRELLEAVPYAADSVVEDLEYHLHLIAAGRRVRFVEECSVFGEMPPAGTGAETQRARWEGGRLLMMRKFPLPLLRHVVSGRIRFLEPLLDVLSLPIGLVTLSLLLLLASPWRWQRWYGVAGLAILSFHFLLAVKAGPDFWRSLRVLLLVPRYLFWKLRLLPKTLLASRRNASWVRTQRVQPADFSSRPQPDALE